MSARSVLLRKLTASSNLAVERAVEVAHAEATPREQGELADSLPTVEVPKPVLEAGLGVLTAFGPE